MSWLFSQALVEEYLVDTSLDGEQSAQLNGSPTPQAFCAPDKMTDFSRLSRFGMTYKPLTESRGKELLTLYLAGFHAKTFQLQEKAQALRASALACGAIWPASLARFDPVSCSWRTAQPSLLGDSDECSVTWPRSGMTAGGLCWELQMLAHRTSATASGLWPTPTVCGNHNRKGASATSGDGLATAVKQWATPICRDSRTVRGGARTMNALGSEPLITQVAQAEGATDGALNPVWVEWLMGWPLGWTDLKPLETGKSHCVQQQHGES